MPIFEYTCSKCGRNFEELVRSAGQKVTCPACGSSKIEKNFSLFADSGGNCKTCSTSGPT